MSVDELYALLSAWGWPVTRMGIDLVMNIVNAAVCMATVYACVCRLRLTDKTTRIDVLGSIVFVLTISVASGFRGPLFGEEVRTLWPILLNAGMLSLMVVSRENWRYGAPAYTQIQAARSMVFVERRKQP